MGSLTGLCPRSPCCGRDPMVGLGGVGEGGSWVKDLLEGKPIKGLVLSFREELVNKLRAELG